MNYKFLLPFALLLTACAGNNAYDTNLLKARTGGVPQGILLSCTYCGCVVNALRKEKELLAPGPVFASSRCITAKDSINITELSQASLDSVYEENYNIILFKRTAGDQYTFRLIQTKEALRLREIAIAFFGLQR